MKEALGLIRSFNFEEPCAAVVYFREAGMGILPGGEEFLEVHKSFCLQAFLLLIINPGSFSGEGL